MRLPDGTIAWLNAMSSIYFPTVMNVDKRIVEVTGEVYFEVKKDKEKPFIVRTKEEEILVLGTAFNVHAYEDEKDITTTLLEGAVKVNGIVLKPGEEVTGNIARKADINKTMAWKNGLFDFDNVELYSVLTQLSRWYDVDIIYTGNIPVKKFRGKMDRGLELSQVLDILRRLGVQFEIKGRQLMVSSK